MSHLIALVMAIMLSALVFRVALADDPTWLLAGAAILAAGPVLLALVRTVPNAVRLGRRTDGAEEQTRLARSVLVDHVVCLGCMSAFLAGWLIVA
jgi:hypothetical protein